jgi:uncharacterized protein (DUF2132 family)
MDQQPNNPLHGIKLEYIIKYLHAFYGWEQLAYHIPVNCFKSNPSLKSSLTFLRKTPWARQRVEDLFLKITREGIDPVLSEIASL